MYRRVLAMMIACVFILGSLTPITASASEVTNEVTSETEPDTGEDAEIDGSETGAEEVVGTEEGTQEEVTQTAQIPVKESKGTLNVQAIPVMEDSAIATSPYKIETNDELMAENDQLELYVQSSSLIIKVKSKETGYIWSSAVPFDMTMGMSTEWQRMSQSVLTMDYISKGTIKRSPLKHASAKQPKINKIQDGFEATVNFYEAKATLTFKVVLDGSSMKFSIPDESIVLEEGNLVNKIYIMPFFGASYQNNIPGYLFIPDGTGALMRFQESRPYKTQYQQKVYGEDLAVSKSIAVAKSEIEAKTKKIQVPVFGAVHGNKQNAFAGIITSGSEYSELIANPAGNIVDYNWIAPAFLYNEQYWQPTGKADGFYGNQPKMNVVNVEVQYQFLSNENADYVGMANAYKEKLLQKNTNLSKNEAGSDVGLKIDAFMAEPKKALVGKQLKVMTEISDVSDWVKELQEYEIDNLNISLVGFEKEGFNGHKFGEFSIDGTVGNTNDMTNLLALLEENLYIQSNFSTGYSNQFSKSQLKAGMNGAILQKKEIQPIFSERVWANDAAMKKGLENYINKSPAKSLAIEGISNELNSDYQRNSSVYRHETLENIQALLKEAIEKSTNIALEAPNFYALEVGDIKSVFHMPVDNTRYSYFTDTVPFLQIVLSGYVDTYSYYQNFTTNTIQDVLKLIDYNMYPSYILTEEPSTELANSNMSSLYSSKYDTWKEHIANHYQLVNEVLSQVTGSEIVGRSVPQDGVSITNYSNGVTIVVNYNKTEVTMDKTKIDGMSAVILKKEGAN